MKPDPAFFQLALRAVEARAEDAVMVGDTYKNDIRPAIELGMRTVWVLHRPEKEKADLIDVMNGDAPPPDLTLASIAELASYTGIEASEYLCKRYGWQQAQIETYKPAAPFDVVVCYDVLQYLDSDTANRALANFAKLCRGVLYFTALTRVDWQLNCDQSRTDSNVHLRSAHWYRSRLRPHFREAGCGFWLRRGAPFTVWDLESL